MFVVNKEMTIGEVIRKDPRVTSETHAASLPSSRVAEAKGDVKRNRPMSCAERNRKRVRVSGSFL